MADIGISIGLAGVQAYNAQLVKISITTTAQMGKVNTSFSKASQGLRGLTSQVPGLGTALAALVSPVTAITAGIAGIGIAFAKSVGTARNFQQAVTDVAAITGDGQGTAAFAAITEEARRLGAETEASATQAAQAMEELARAGLNTSQIIESAGDTIALSTIGNISLAKSADIATNVLSQFGKEASELGGVIDIIAKTTNTSNTNVTQFAEALNFLGPTANLVGVSLEESAAAVGLLANSGLKGSLATRALGTSFANLSKPTAKMRLELEELGKRGFSAFENGEFVGIANLIEGLETSLAGYSQEQRLASLSTLFGAEAIQELGILLKAGSGELREYTDEIRAAGEQNGAFAETIRQIKLNTFEGSIKLLRSAWEELQLTLADGSLDFLADSTRTLADGLRNVARLIKGELDFGNLFGDVGVQLDAIGDTISETFSNIRSALAPIGAAFDDAFGGLGSSLTSGLVSALEAVNFVIGVIGERIRAVAELFSSVATSVLPSLSGAFTAAKDAISDLSSLIGDILGPILDKSGGQFEVISKVIEVGFVAVIKAAALAIRVFANIVSGTIAVIRGTIEGAVESWKILKVTISAALNTAGELVSDFGKSVKREFEGIGNVLKGAFTLDFSTFQKGFDQLDNNVGVSGGDIGKTFRENFLKSAKIEGLISDPVRKELDAVSKVVSTYAPGEDLVPIDFSVSLDGKTVEELNARIQQLRDIQSRPISNSIFEQTQLEINRVQKAITSLGDGVDVGKGITDSVAPAIGSIKELSDRLSGLNEKLSVAAPTKNVDSINDQIKSVGRELAGLSLERLGIDVSLGLGLRDGEAERLEADIQRTRDAIEAQKIIIEAITSIDTTEADEALIRLEGLEDYLSTLEGVKLSIDVDSENGLARIAEVEKEIESVRASIGREALIIEAAAVVDTSALLDARNEITALNSDLARLESVRLSVDTGDSASALQAVTGQIEVIQRQVESAKLNLGSIEVGTQAAKDASDVLATLQTRLDVLEGQKLVIEGTDLPVLEAQIKAVADALLTVPTGGASFEILTEKARELNKQLQDVQTFKVIAESDGSLEALEAKLKVLRAGLQDPVSGSFLPEVQAQIQQVEAEIARVSRQKILIEVGVIGGIELEGIDLNALNPIEPIEPLPITFDVTPPELSGVTEALAINQEEVATITARTAQLATDVFQTVANGVSSAFSDFGRELGKAVKTGQGATEAFAALFKGLLDVILVQVPNLLGTYLLQTAVGMGFPAGIPAAIAGVALLGLSGFSAGLLSGGDSGQDVASPGQVASGGAESAGLTGAGLGTFNAENTGVQINNAITIVQDVDGIATVVEERIIRSESNTIGR